MIDILEKLKRETNLDKINEICKKSLIDHLGIVFTKLDEGGLWGEFTVDERTKRPFGGLHGGSTAAFAESLGSVLSYLIIGGANLYGVELNINHLKAAKLNEKILGCASPIHIGKKTHVHDIKFYNQKNDLIATSRLTVLVVDNI